ncbi:DUF4059 family protein [Streptococcus catagoni]|uniref:DUF4059 family protein n=1 Tax=Streptococcus catagoni TaxID=2654874 RepID=UPI00140C8E6F|nr:DUF4059 family protein [Streptococcus catagoni]
MLVELFSLYLQGLLLSAITVLVASLVWIFCRAKRKKDKTVLERQAFLYEMIMISILLIPILSFAFMSILLVLKS